MLPHPTNLPSSDSVERQARRQALLERLRPALEQAALDLADQLVDLPDDQLFGRIEFALRDRAHRLAAEAHQAALDGREKKTATTAPAPSAAPAAGIANSSPTSTGTS